jgi:hypothetical protein
LGVEALDDGLSDMRRNTLLKLPKQVGLIMPDRMYTRLRFSGITAITVPTTSAVGFYRYRPSSAYDIDPALGSTAMPGYTELAAFYQTYRVTMSRMKIIVVNPSPVTTATVAMGPVNFDPGATPSAGYITAMAGQPYAQYKLAGLLGSPPITLESTMSTEKIFGSRQIYFDDNFNSLVTGIPINNWFWVIGLALPGAPASAIIFQILIEIDVGIEFFDRKPLVN